MKSRIVLFTLSSLLVLPVVALADPSPNASAKAHGDHEHTELEEHMEKIGRAFRALQRQIADPAKNEESLKLVGTMRQNAEASIHLEPQKLAEVPADKRAAFLAAYRDGMKGMVSGLEALESALKAGDNAKAGERVQQLKKGMEDSHKQFKKEKKKEKK